MSQQVKEAFDSGRDSKGKKWEDYEHHRSDIMDLIYAISKEFGLSVHQYFPKK